MISPAEQGQHCSSQMGTFSVLRGTEVHRLSLCPYQQQHRRDKASARCKKNWSSNDPKHESAQSKQSEVLYQGRKEVPPTPCSITSSFWSLQDSTLQYQLGEEQKVFSGLTEVCVQQCWSKVTGIKQFSIMHLYSMPCLNKKDPAFLWHISVHKFLQTSSVSSSTGDYTQLKPSSLIFREVRTSRTTWSETTQQKRKQFMKEIFKLAFLTFLGGDHENLHTGYVFSTLHFTVLLTPYTGYPNWSHVSKLVFSAFKNTSKSILGQ